MQNSKNERLAQRFVGLRGHVGLWGCLLLVMLLAVACTAPEQAAPAEEVAEAEATAEPEEEAAEAEATAEPEEEAAEVAEEATEVEATAEPEEEAAEVEATAEPEEEAAEVEATAEPEEEAAEGEMASAGDPIAGLYIRTMAGGCGCHFNQDLEALAGGRGFMDDAVFSKNLTPHETGIANMSDEALADSIRYGRHDDHILAVMPHWSTMADNDVQDLIAYLRSLDPVENEIPARTLAEEPVVPEYPPAPAVAPTEGAERGGYIASIVRCGRCHMPSNEDGSPNMDMMLAGAPYRDTVAPNITPDEETGIGAWSEDELVAFLSTGVYADGTESHSGMKGVADNIISKLTENDQVAIAQFLMSLPPVSNDPQPSE